MGVVSYFGFQNGKPERLLAPLDADGMFCGLDKGYEQHHYLYFLDVSSGVDIMSSAVCVSSCPLNDTVPIDCVPTKAYPDCNKFKYPQRYDTMLLFQKACLPNLEKLVEADRERYDNIIAGLGIDDVGEAINDLINSWPIYAIALGTTFIIT